MIIELPTANDFAVAGMNSLNLAWTIITQHSMELEQAEVETWDQDGEVTEEYWRRSQATLGHALTLVQQGQELLIKARISEVSVFLLISGQPREWPQSDKKDVSFSEFRTVDAVDLIKLHNSVRTDPLNEEFGRLFDLIRRRRNQIIHQGKDKEPIDVGEMLEAILTTVQRLAPMVRWMKQRAIHLQDEDRIAVAYSSDHVVDQICVEAQLVIKHLGAGSLNKFFSFDKKARRYLCPECNSYADMGPYYTAHLRPNTPTSTLLFCLACDGDYEVERKKCVNSKCPSNVVSKDGLCLRCWTDQ